MKKENIIIVLLLLLVLATVILIYGYFKGKELTGIINQLERDRNQLTKDKEQCLNEREQCKTEVQDLNSKLSMLKEDVAKIFRSCISQNACKGKYPNIRWYCNNAGDETNNPTHICLCDSSCNLITTEIEK